MISEQSIDLSIIVPVYNVKNYLPQCLESISRQRDVLLEVILSDDGSYDGSEQLCDEFVNTHKDLNVRVIHEINGGLSVARNRGLEIATGKYVAFLDSDDYLLDDFAVTMFRAAERENADIVVCSYYEDKSGVVYQRCISNETLSSKEALEKLCINKEIKNFSCGKIYRRELFRTVRFPEGRLFEDIATIYKLFRMSQKIICISEILWSYRIREESISGKSKKDFFAAFHRCVSHIERYLDLSSSNPELIPAMLHELTFSIGLVYGSENFEKNECLIFIETFAQKMITGQIQGVRYMDFFQRIQFYILSRKTYRSKSIILLHDFRRIYRKIFPIKN